MKPMADSLSQIPVIIGIRAVRLINFSGDSGTTALSPRSGVG